MDESERVLKKVIENLRSKKEVDAVFLTGSGGRSPLKPWSDIDLIIVFKKNTKQLYSLFTWIGGRFADIFFFDLGDMARIEKKRIIGGNTPEGTFVDWLKSGSIQFDKSGKTTELKALIARGKIKCRITREDTFSFQRKVSYNYTANNRYFSAKDPLYHEALELRLLYSVIELALAYFVLRGIPWRGEKNAMKYFKQKDGKYYTALARYFAARDLKTRMKLYNQMVPMALTKQYGIFPKSKIIAVAHKDSYAHSVALTKYWKKLVS